MNESFARAIRFRSQFDILTRGMGNVSALILNPAANQSLATYGVALTNAELAELNRRQEVADAAYAIRDDALANASNEYAGIYLDNLDAGLVKVAFTANLQSHLDRIRGFFPYPDQVRTIPARFSYAQLDQIQETIDNSTPGLDVAGVHVVSTTIDEKTNTVAVGVRAPLDEATETLRTLFGQAVQTYLANEPTLTAGRDGNFNPLRGGIQIAVAGSQTGKLLKDCTAGFMASGDGRRLLLAAGHCVPKEYRHSNNPDRSMATDYEGLRWFQTRPVIKKGKITNGARIFQQVLRWLDEVRWRPRKDRHCSD